MGTYIASIIFIIVNNAAMNMGVHGYFWISVFTSDMYAGVEMLDHMVVLFLVILDTSILFHSGYINIPTNYSLGFPFSISLPTFVICVLLDDNYSDRCEMVPHCGFHLHFHDDQQYWAFHVLVGHLNFFLENCQFRSSAQFLIKFVCFDVELYELFIYWYFGY